MIAPGKGKGFDNSKLKDKICQAMFDNIKKLHQLKKMQDEFKKEKLTLEERGVTVTMNGAFEIEEIKLNQELSVSDQQDVLKHCLNKAREELQQTLAKKMMASGVGL